MTIHFGQNASVPQFQNCHLKVTGGNPSGWLTPLPTLGNPKRAVPPLTGRNLLCYRDQAVSDTFVALKCCIRYGLQPLGFRVFLVPVGHGHVSALSQEMGRSPDSGWN
jgi:hypothetical protein